MPGQGEDERDLGTIMPVPTPPILSKLLTESSVMRCLLRRSFWRGFAADPCRSDFASALLRDGAGLDS
jgi:hypothetical protein